MNQTTSNDSSSFVRSLARGLTVIEMLGGEMKGLSLSDVAVRCELDRATARRFLLTLVEMGYVRVDNARYMLAPRSLRLGYAYLSSYPLWEIVKPFMAKLVEQVHESCSVATLDEGYAVYVARIRSNERYVDVNRTVGSRIAAYCTSLGRVLLAGQEEQERKRLLATVPIAANTDRTVTDVDSLLAILSEVREQGWAVVDQEFEPGLVSLAVPILDKNGSALAALNISAQTGRLTAADLVARYLTPLQDTAAEITHAFVSRGNQ